MRLAVGLLAFGLAPAPAALAASGSPANSPPRVVLVLLDAGVDPRELAAALPEASPGGLSAGLSNVPAAQTYLDISQGNRIFTSLYPDRAPRSFRTGALVPGWQALLERAQGAPADLVPGLLGGALVEAEVPIHVDPSLRTPAVLAAQRDGQIARGAPGQCISAPCPPGFDVLYANRAQLPAIASNLELERGEDMLIALERPPPPARELLSVAILGRGYDGQLTSDTTRSPGLVASTDLAPTILERFGVAVPEQVGGEAIRSEGSRDAGAVADRGHRLSVITKRRDPVIFDNALLWLFLALAAIAFSRGRAARTVLPLLALSCVYLPLMLIATAALDPTRIVERAVVGLGAPLLALVSWRLLRGYAALAFACALTVGAYAVDVIAGSPLTSLALIGPNPAVGVRFFGIGNELEATVAVLVPVGVGAMLAAFGAGESERGAGRTAAVAFLAAGAIGAVVFGLGRFGADVGAVIVLPIGAAVAAAVAVGMTSGRRALLAVLGAPVLALAALAALDLALGGGAHLTSSVLEAGGAGDLGDVLERRLRLSAKSFGNNADSPYFYLTLVAAVLAVRKRRTVASWFDGRRAALAGLCGAAAATLVGTLANDSGALLLMIGSAYLLAAAAFAWAQTPPSEQRSR